MKVKLLSAFLFFTFQLTISQTIKGKVIFNNYVIPNVEVINYNTKTTALSDANGNFSINAKNNDVLVFVAKQYELKKLIINPKLFTGDELVVELILKAEQLEEVLVSNIPSIKISKDAVWEQNKLDQYTLEKNATTLKVPGVKMGGIENGADLMRIGGMALGLFTKEKEPRKAEIAAKHFEEVVKASCNQNYFVESLQLKPDEIELFIQYCEVDPRSKIIAEKNNPLSTMDFLFQKSINFKKL